MAGSTGWHYTISYDVATRPQLPSFSAGAAGRTFPSAAGFEISDLFFTDDNGTYYFPTRDFIERKGEERMLLLGSII
jgi:hypothetical protein